MPPSYRCLPYEKLSLQNTLLGLRKKGAQSFNSFRFLLDYQGIAKFHLVQCQVSIKDRLTLATQYNPERGF